MKIIKPHPFQAKAIEDAISVMEALMRALLVSPPGSGKTIMIAGVVKYDLSRNRRIIIAAQRRELLKQIRKHLLLFGIDKDLIGAVYPNADAPLDLTRPIQITSVPTLLRRRLRPDADTLILDEAHHGNADGHSKLLKHYGSSRVLGLTATPIRLDGKGLGDFFDVLITAAVPSELIKDNLLAKPRVFTTAKEFLPILTNLRRAMGDYVPRDLEKRVSKQPLIGNIVDHYVEKGSGKTALVFGSSVAHSMDLTRRFTERGISAEHLDAKTKTRDRDDVVKRLHTGETKVVCNVGILSEGFDLPRTDVVILARPTLSLALFIQQTGRGMRWYKGHRPIILDHAGNVTKFGLPEADREFDLQDSIPITQNGHAPVKVCPDCYAVVALGCRVCPECKRVLVEVNLIPDEIVASLEEMTERMRDLWRNRLEAYLEKYECDMDPVWVEKVLEAFSARSSATR